MAGLFTIYLHWYSHKHTLPVADLYRKKFVLVSGPKIAFITSRIRRMGKVMFSVCSPPGGVLHSGSQSVPRGYPSLWSYVPSGGPPGLEYPSPSQDRGTPPARTGLPQARTGVTSPPTSIGIPPCQDSGTPLRDGLCCEWCTSCGFSQEHFLVSWSFRVI